MTSTPTPAPNNNLDRIFSVRGERGQNIFGNKLTASSACAYSRQPTNPPVCAGSLWLTDIQFPILSLSGFKGWYDQIFQVGVLLWRIRWEDIRTNNILTFLRSAVIFSEFAGFRKKWCFNFCEQFIFHLFYSLSIPKPLSSTCFALQGFKI